LRHEPHFVCLKNRLKNPKIKRAVGDVLAVPARFPGTATFDDLKYAADVGSLKADSENSAIYKPANPMCQEILVRTLTEDIQRKAMGAIPESCSD
jgi:uncharacterized protein (DUF934 family)